MKLMTVIGVISSLFGVFGEVNQTIRSNYDATACNRCSNDVCSILPPATSPGYPCYQGNNADTKFCFNTDPLLVDGSKWVCGTCDQFGYPTYLRNDPIYKDMELWSD